MSKRWSALVPCLCLALVFAGCDDDDDDLCAEVDCGAHGACNPEDGLCECDAGWSGAACDVEDVEDLCEGVDCGAHGACNPEDGLCECDAGWSGAACDVEDVEDLCEEVDCGAHGVCNPEDGLCECDAGWSGAACDVEDLCHDVDCGENARCVEADGSCECDEGYQMVGEPGECLREVLADFEDLSLEAESFWNGADGSGSFTSGGVTFYNDYNAEWFSWDGFAYSNVTDATTAGYDNQYGVITAGGHAGSANFGVVYVSAMSTIGLPTLELAEASTLSGLYVTNTTYPYLSMRDGDDYAKQFGGETGADPDWFLLTIEGFDAEGDSTGTVEFYLADFRAEDAADDYIISDWTFVDLTALGVVATLQLSLSSSDMGEWGMNTPSYFAIDDVMLYGH
jgi:hypothetical protein